MTDQTNFDPKIYFKADPILCRIVERLPLPQVHSTKNVFHDLLSCVLEGVIHYRSRGGLFDQLLDEARMSNLTVDKYEAFEKKALRTGRVTDERRQTTQNVAAYWKMNPDLSWLTMTEQELRGHFSKINGVGEHCTEMILLYTLGLPNINPIHDRDLAIVVENLYDIAPNDNFEQRILEISSAWGDQVSLAVKYLIDWHEHGKQL